MGCRSRGLKPLRPKAFLDVLGVFAEFETNVRKERQVEGIAKAKAAGVYKGRKPVSDTTKVKGL
jgi:DNA invertase Pin-like site-specific DNA recombinase